MVINSNTLTYHPAIQPSDVGEPEGAPEAIQPFREVFERAVSSLRKTQQDADGSLQTFLTGGPIELHNVMLAQERAAILFQGLVQVRNQVMDAYQQLMRMPV